MPARIRIRIVCLLVLALPALVFGQYGYPRMQRGRRIGPNNGVPDGVTPLVSLRGSLRSIDKKKVLIDTGEDQILTFKRSKKTKFLKGDKEIEPDAFPDGAAVTIEASRAQNGDYDALNVFLGEPPDSGKDTGAGKDKGEPPAAETGPKSK
jgi:hypothetical protein